MATVPELIYCANGNKRFAQIAIDAGFLYGAQLPGTIYHGIHFADQNWKRPDRARYMTALAEYRPHMASVLDLEHEAQLPEVLEWAEEAAQFVRVVMIIPKVFGIIPRLPWRIGGADVRLGYSVPTKHGGTEVPVWEFFGWPVHLLGGSPHRQMAIRKYLDVRSVDGNMPQKIALNYSKYWSGGKWRDDVPQMADAPYEAFARSCQNIYAAWHN